MASNNQKMLKCSYEAVVAVSLNAKVVLTRSVSKISESINFFLELNELLSCALFCIEGYGIVFEQIYQDLVYILISIINNTMLLQLSKDTLPDSASHLGDYDGCTGCWPWCV